MIKKILFLIAVVCFAFATKGYSQSVFPFNESFARTAANTQNLLFGSGGQPGQVNALLTAGVITQPKDGGGFFTPDADGTGFLRLTSNASDQAGYARSTISFPSGEGIDVSFEYFSYGGQNGSADGITFFLYDAAANPFVIGGFGGSLGYSQYNKNNASTDLPGVSKGYLGVGIDEFGNFSNADEARQGGDGGRRMSSLVLRGAGDGFATDGLNYQFLRKVQTEDNGTPPNDFTNGGNPSYPHGGNGLYAARSFPIIGDIDGRTAGGGPASTIGPADVGYRKIRIILEKANPNDVDINKRTGYNITTYVWVGGDLVPNVFGGGTGIYRLFNKYNYPASAGVMPPLLSFGFAASTGGENNYHEIRNIEVIIPPSVAKPPVAVANAAIMKQGDPPITFNITNNDYDPNGNGTLNTATGVDIDLTVAGIQTTKTVAGEGTYVYNGNKTITFTPLSTFNGVATIPYTIEDNAGDPMTGDVVTNQTSNQANISVTVLGPISGASTVCVGSTSQLGNTTSGGTWTSSDQSKATIDLNSGLLTGVASGSTTVTYSVTAGSTTVQETKLITVNARAVSGDISVAPPATICAGGSATLTPSLTVANSITSPVYTWYANADRTGPITTGGNFNVTGGALTVSNLATTTTYYVSVQGSDRCENAPNALHAVTINVTPRAVAADISVTPPSAVCIGGSATLTPSLTVANSITSPVYTWYINADRTGQITTGGNFTVTGGALTVANLGATVTYYVSVQGTEKCENAANTLRAVTITVNPRAVAADISVTPPSAICAGGSSTLTPLLAVANSITSPVYTWYANADRTFPITTGGNFTVTNGALTVANLGATTTYYVSVQGADKCENAANTLRAVIINVNPLPIAAISYTGSPFCPVGTVAVTRTGQTGGTYSAVAGLSINVNTGLINLAQSTPGTYTVTYSFTNGTCANTATTDITVNALPTVSAITGPSGTNVGFTITLSNTTTGGTWSSDNTGVASVNATSGVVTGVSAGTATITYTVTSGGCTNSVNKVITITAPSVSNNPPLVQDITKTGNKDIPVPFTADNFKDRYTDPENTPLVKVKIVTLPSASAGKLKLDGVDITAGQEIPVADLSKITFIPVAGFVGGPVSFEWNGSDGSLYANTPKNVNITIVSGNIPPVAVTDTFSTSKGATLTISVPGVLQNDSDANGNAITAIKVSDPTNGTVTLNSNGSFVYVHNGGTSTSDSFTYKVNDGTSDGNTATVIITITAVNAPPVVADISKTGTGFTPVTFDLTDFTSKYTDPESSPLSKVKITSLPPVGVLRLNGVAVTLNQEILANQLNTLTFEAPVNWNGTATFGWNGNDGTAYALANANVNISILLAGDPTAKIGIAKNLASVKPALNGTYDVKFIFTVVNYGLNTLERISVKDNLAQAFGGAKVTLKSITSFGNLKPNLSYNGVSDTELLLPASKLTRGEEATIELMVNIHLIASGGLFQNSATAEGYSAINGIKVADVSSNGLKPDPLVSNDVTPSEPTPIQLDAQPIYSPEGFSPNGDGINDSFVIQNTNGKLVSLEIFNRWGNRIYKSNDYRNDWNGQVTEGFFLGRDIPDGTYYYVIVIEKKDKYVGFITINR